MEEAIVRQQVFQGVLNPGILQPYLLKPAQKMPGQGVPVPPSFLKDLAQYLIIYGLISWEISHKITQILSTEKRCLFLLKSGQTQTMRNDPKCGRTKSLPVCSEEPAPGHFACPQIWSPGSIWSPDLLTSCLAWVMGFSGHLSLYQWSVVMPTTLFSFLHFYLFF